MQVYIQLNSHIASLIALNCSETDRMEKKNGMIKESSKSGLSFHFPIFSPIMFNRVYSGIKQHLTKLQTESDQTNPNNNLTPSPTTQSCPPNLIQNHEPLGSEPITISPARGESVRRRSSLFGISQNQHDDFVQKDLMGSSWS